MTPELTPELTPSAVKPSLLRPLVVASPQMMLVQLPLAPHLLRLEQALQQLRLAMRKRRKTTTTTRKRRTRRTRRDVQRRPALAQATAPATTLRARRLPGPKLVPSAPGPAGKSAAASGKG